MTSASSPSGTNGLSATVVAPDVIVQGSLVRALRACRVPVVEWTFEQLARAEQKAEVVCTDPSLTTAVLGLNVPTVVVTRGMTVSDEVWGELVRRQPVIIRHRDLTPVALLEGLLRARFGIGFGGDVPPSLSWVPPTLLRAFLARPRTIKHMGDFALAAGTSREELRQVAKGVGCERFEHVATRLRADVWRWLVSAGLDRRLVEDYLGVTDRSHVRRACRRARIPVPWNRE
jgi:hypothetical protein